MKKIWFTILILLLSEIIIAQINIERIIKYFPVKGNKIEYSGVVKYDTAYTSDFIFKNARQWMIDNYKPDKNVLLAEDKEAGYIIGQGYFEVDINPVALLTTNSRIWFTVSIEIKEGRYRYRFYDIFYETMIAMVSDKDLKFELENFMSVNNDSNKAIKFYREVDRKFNGYICTLKSKMLMLKRDEW
jgi:hypothetical protein